MAQIFQYPNLLSGTRSGEGWKIAGGKPVTPDKSAYKWGPVLPCYNSAATETYLWSPPVTLHRDTGYVLSFLAAGTDNLKGVDVHVLDVDASYVGWVGAEMYIEKPGGGGSLVLPAVSPLGGVARRRVVQNQIRQQRQRRRRDGDCVVCERHAHRGHGAARMGTGRRGGVAMSDEQGASNFNLLSGSDTSKVLGGSWYPVTFNTRGVEFGTPYALSVTCDSSADGLGLQARLNYWSTDGKQKDLSDTPSTRLAKGKRVATFVIPGFDKPDDFKKAVLMVQAGSISGKGTIKVSRPMLVEGTEPAAWAPAEGETLAGGGCAHER